MTSQNLDEFTCCLSSDKHFIIQPKRLKSCGHLACIECFSITNQETNIVCKKCDVKTLKELNMADLK
jgi:hypothetical protein